MKKTKFDTEEKMIELASLIEQDNPASLKAWFETIIEQEYTAGEQENHKRSLDKIMVQYKTGFWKPSQKKLWAMERLSIFFKDVALKNYK
jgi:hypothetical protein